MTKASFSHIDESGHAHMVNVGNKSITDRIAVAKGEVHLTHETVELVRKGLMKKGDILTVAKTAGIMGAKKTSELIPLCHNIPLHQIELDIKIDDALPGIVISATTHTSGKTGVEMEALTAVAIAALTVYDMVKAVEKTGQIQNIRLVEKRGGRSGDLILETSN